MTQIKELRYQVMLALYLPILLYAFSTYDLNDQSYVVQRLDPVVVGEETVVLGQPFTARTFLAVGGNQGQNLQSSGDLQVLGDSAFQMQTASLLGEDEQEKTIQYSGRFGFQQIDGESVEIPVQGAFKVRRPEVVAASEATQSLYRRTLNSIRIEVPGLEDRSLRLETGNTRVDGRSIQLSPSGNNTSVRVYLDDPKAGDVFLGTKSFGVIEPPRPEVRVLNAGRTISSGDNLPRQRAMLEFQVEADEEFKRSFPRDARYSVGKATVYIRKGQAASREIGTFDVDGGRLVLTRQLRDAQPGDRIVVQLSGIYRINHAGAAIPVQLNESSLTYGFTIS